MKSLYQNKNFAEYWNERAGKNGEAYKRYVLDPLMFKVIRTFKDKTILELGCGNGYLATKFLQKKARKVILVDISRYNLEFARALCNDSRVSFIEQDATKKWKVESKKVDVIYSNAMLNEVGNIKTPLKEAYRVLKSKGVFIFSVTHPAWDLYVYAQQKVGATKQRIRGLGGYFERKFAKYIMSGSSKSNPALKNKFGNQEFAVDHYHRTITDYFDALIKAGFEVKNIIEPELTPQLLKYNPRFEDSRDFPVTLVFYAIKN